MNLQDVINLIDFPSDVTITVYDYTIWDDIFVGLSEDVPQGLLARKVSGVEIPAKNKLVINLEAEK